MSEPNIEPLQRHTSLRWWITEQSQLQAVASAVGILILADLVGPGRSVITSQNRKRPFSFLLFKSISLQPLFRNSDLKRFALEVTLAWANINTPNGPAVFNRVASGDCFARGANPTCAGCGPRVPTGRAG